MFSSASILSKVPGVFERIGPMRDKQALDEVR